MEVSEEDMTAIDLARSKISRADYCRDRILHTNGFADPSFGLCAAILGKLAVISEDRWAPFDNILELMRLVDGLSHRVAISASDLSAMETWLSSIHDDLTQLFVTADTEKRAIGDLLELANKFVPFETLGSDPFSDMIKLNWHRTDK